MGVLAPDENQTEVPSPVSVYLNDDGMTVQLYYEGHPDHATDTDIIGVTLYDVSDEVATPSCELSGTIEDYCACYNIGYTAYVSTKTCQSSLLMRLTPRGLALARQTVFCLAQSFYFMDILISFSLIRNCLGTLLLFVLVLLLVWGGFVEYYIQRRGVVWSRIML